MAAIQVALLIRLAKIGETLTIRVPTETPEIKMSVKTYQFYVQYAAGVVPRY